MEKFVMNVSGIDREEIALILRDIALQLENTSNTAKRIADENNRKIGQWELTPADYCHNEDC